MTNLDASAAQLTTDRPPNWEYRLAAMWLREGFAGVDRQLADLKRGVIFRPARVLPAAEFSGWAEQKADDIVALAKVITTVLTDDLTPAFCEPGQPGDPGQIRQAVDRLIEAGRNLVEWEIEVQFTRVADDELQGVKEMMSGWAEDLLRQIEAVPTRLEELVAQAVPGESYELRLLLTPPPGLNECTAQLGRIARTRAKEAGRRRPSCFLVLAVALFIGLATLCILAGATG